MARIRPFITIDDDEPINGRAYCSANSAAADEFIIELAAPVLADKDLALVAVGGFGRGELAPGSDLDLILLHGRSTDATEAANAIWYPLWDTGLKLGHAVHTPADAARLASEELARLTAFSSMRTLAGRLSLTADLTARVSRLWRRGEHNMVALAKSVNQRHREQGDVAHHLEPDLKEGRGGLRDVHALRWVEAGRPGRYGLDLDRLVEPYDRLLDVRVALHLVTGRTSNRLMLEDQDAVAKRLGVDSLALMTSVAEASSAISWSAESTWGQWHRAKDGPPGGWRTVEHQNHIVETGGEVKLGAQADPTDPLAVLRLASTAATTKCPIDESTLQAISAVRPLPGPWPVEARQQLVELLGCGRDAIPVIESLDQYRVVEVLLPEWAAVRHLPQRSALHTFTVDRHLCEAAANAAGLTATVQRPDLLLIGTWLHDIGKGRPGDHTEVGMAIIGDVGARLGFDPTDVRTLVRLCEHHLLLSDVAVRRDLDDPGTIAAVADAVETSEFLDLLAALTEADSVATGPSVWGEWKAQRLVDLVSRVRHVLEGGEIDDGLPTSLDDLTLEHLRRRQHLLAGNQDRLSMVAPDEPFIFGRVAGALAVAGLTVVSAVVYSASGWAAADYVVTPSVDRADIDWPAVVELVERSLRGEVALTARLAKRAALQAPFVRPQSAEAPRRTVVLDDELSDRATVIDVHAPDRIGLLFDLTRVLSEMRLDVRSATAQTVADQAIDSFYVTTAQGEKLKAAGLIDEVRLALEHAITPGFLDG